MHSRHRSRLALSLPAMAWACLAGSACAQPAAEAGIHQRALDLLARMTVEEKAGQLTQYFKFPNSPDQIDKAKRGQSVEEKVAEGKTGSLLFVSDAAEIDRLQHLAVDTSRLGIPLLFGFDVIHGFRTALPVPIAMAASWDPATVERAQAVAAAEARAVGLNWTFAPVADIARDPRWGRIVESSGEDPYLAARITVAQVRGFQGVAIGAPGHVIATAKHFVGYGASQGGRDYDEVNLSDNELWNSYLPSFQAAIDAGVGSVMSAYMPLNGVPAAGNRRMLTDVLRGAMGFGNFVVSDAGSVFNLRTQGLVGDVPSAGVRALKAGLDMEMAYAPGTSGYETLPQSLAAGRIMAADLDRSVLRVLEAKLRMGLFEHPYVDTQRSEAILSDPAHRAVARIAAERAAVLLRNEGSLLPLTAAVKSIAVIGPLADAARDQAGPWIFHQDDRETVTVLAGLKARAGAGVTVAYSPGVTMPERTNPTFFDATPGGKAPRVVVDDTAEIARAVGMAKPADVAVLVLGEAQNMIGENASRSSLDLPGRQQELLDAVIATGKPVVVLLMSARPLDLKGAKPNALMDIWYPGTRGGEAVARLLFGDVVPGGKLPYTWPRDVGQIPLTYAHLLSHSPKGADTRYWNGSNAPLYPFGFGLSYARFSYGKLTVLTPRVAVGQPVRVQVDVRNDGAVAGDEVAQLYLHQRSGTSARPLRELHGFERVALRPGETRTVTFDLQPRDLAYWSSETQGRVQDAATFDVWAGGDSTAQLAAHFEVEAP